MGESVTKLGEAKISPQNYFAFIKEVRPFLKGKPGDIVEFHLENGEIILRLKEK